MSLARTTLPNVAVMTIGGQGRLIGQELAWQFLKSDFDEKQIVETCGLYFVLLACVDHLMDDQPDGWERLRPVWNPDAIERALNLGRARNGGTDDVVDVGCDSDIHAVSLLTASFFSQCRNLAGNEWGNVLWTRFSNVVWQAFHAQNLNAESNRFSLRPLAKVRGSLRGKSVYPTQILGMIPLLSRSAREVAVSGNLEEILSLFGVMGKIFGLVDDLADLPQDLMRGQMNEAVLSYLESKPDNFVYDSSAPIPMEVLVSEGYVETIIRTLSKDLEHFNRTASRVMPRPDRFFDEVCLWLRSGLNLQ